MQTLSSSRERQYGRYARKIYSICINIILLSLTTICCIFAIDSYVSRFLVTSNSAQQAANAEYNYESADFYFHVKLNSDGFRDKELPVLPPESNTCRIVFLGDSFVFGWGVSADDCFVRLTEAELQLMDNSQHWEVINLGVEGTSPIDYRDYLMCFGDQVSPRIVVVCIYLANDIIASCPPLQERRRAYFRTDLKNLWPGNLVSFARNKVFRVDESTHAKLGQENPLVPLLQSKDPNIKNQFLNIDPIVLHEAIDWRINPYIVAGSFSNRDLLTAEMMSTREFVRNPATKQAILQICNYAMRWNGEIRLLLVPPAYTLNADLWNSLRKMGYIVPDRLLGYRRKCDLLLNWASSNNIPALDLSETLQRCGSSLSFKNDPHWTAATHAHVAKAVSSWIRNPASARAPSARELTSKDKVVWNALTNMTFWHPASAETSMSFNGGLCSIRSRNGTGSIVNATYMLDCSEINVLSIRMQSNTGSYAAFYWGNFANEANSYPFDDVRAAFFPIVSDGEFHVYKIRIDETTPYWKGRWNALRLDTFACHPSEGCRGGEAEIDYIALGHT